MLKFDEPIFDPPAMVQPDWLDIDPWYQSLIDAITERGMVIHHSARIMKQRQLLREFAKDRRRFGPFRDRIPDISTAFADLFQLRIALAVSDQHAGDKLFGQKLGEALKDAVSVSNEKARPTPGRDAQFELFTLGCLNRELCPHFRPPPGPDIAISTSAGAFVLEAKRVRTSNALVQRAKRAGEQIEIAGLPGVLATDLSLLIADDEPDVVSTMAEAGRALGSRLMKLIQDHTEGVMSVSKSRHLVAWSVFVCTMADIGGDLCGPFVHWGHTNMVDEDDPRYQIARRTIATPADYMR